MTSLIYLDTNVYLDLLQNRSAKLLPLGEIALQLIRRTINCEFCLIYSELILKELEKFVPKDIIFTMFKELKAVNKLLFVKMDFEDKKIAKTLNQNVLFQTGFILF